MTGSVQPIAVGSMMRCIVAKVANQITQDDMMALLSPRQLDFELKRAAEAAAHAARSYLCNLHLERLMVKLNFHNAFNSIRRDKMFEATTPDIYPIVHSSSYFFIFFILAADGVQQGDPLGPFLFSITIL